jgi:hypothetical protein
VTAFAPLWPPPGCTDPAAFYASLGLVTPDGVDPVEFWSYNEPRPGPLTLPDANAAEFRRFRYWLGTHEMSWLWDEDIAAAGAGLMVNFGRFRRRVSLPKKPIVPLAIDSQAYTMLLKNGEWTFSVHEYVNYLLDLYDNGLGGTIEFAASMDWPIEAEVLAKTGLTKQAHQHLTVQNFAIMWDLWPHAEIPCPLMPTLQGEHLDEYQHCRQLYADYGIRLSRFDTVGLGSVCTRQDTAEAEEIVRVLANEGLPLHGFGFKVDGLRRVAQYLRSADSMAWSDDARKAAARTRATDLRRMPGCTHASCSNCKWWALAWLDRLRETIGLPRPAPIRTRKQALGDLFDQLWGIAS